jgi:hypothetical protein
MERQVAPLEDAGFAVEVEVAAGSALSGCSSSPSSGEPTSSLPALDGNVFDPQASGVSRRA